MLVDDTNIDHILSTIRTVHQTAINSRLIDLNEYLTEFFQCIQPQYSNSFRLLTRLLREYQDRAALKVEFLKAKCLETLSQKLNSNESDVTSILEFIAELLSNSENVQEKFLHFRGYEVFFNSLRYIHSPNINFINQLILLMIKNSIFSNKDLQTQFADDTYVIFINPNIAISLIHWIPYLSDLSHQHYIISCITKIALRSLQNKMMACSNGVIHALLEILNDTDKNSNQLEEQILFEIFSLLENLVRFSINARDIRYICQLLHQRVSCNKQLIELLIKAAKHDDTDAQIVSSYFDLQQANSGIALPAMRRWPPMLTTSTCPNFSFHCWLKLNSEINSYPFDGRRQIYSFYSDSMGLESFIRSTSLYVSVTDHRTCAYIEINDCNDLIDGLWHSLTIVHRTQRSSLIASAFQTGPTCSLSIYIDGSLRREINDFKYMSILNDPIISSAIGSPCQQTKLATMKYKTDSLSTTISKTFQPIKGLFSTKTRNSNNRKENQIFDASNSIVIDSNAKDIILGQPTCLYGQLACVWVLVEALDESHIKHLHVMGSDFCRQRYTTLLSNNNVKSSTIFDLLSNYSLFAYHPLACNSHMCIDISGGPLQINGRLINVLCARVHLFSQALLSLGGISMLFPLIELFKDDDSYDSDSALQSSEENESSISSFDMKKQPYLNPIASIIHLIRCIISSTSRAILIEQLLNYHNIEILGEHLNCMSPTFVDKQFLTSIEHLIESCQFIESSSLLTSQFTEYILLNFKIWTKAEFTIQTLHLQYVSRLIQCNQKFNQDKFGVEFFLDVLKQYFKHDTDEQGKLRYILFDIIKYLTQNHVHQRDLNMLLSTISILSTSNDVVTDELLNFILESLQTPSSLIRNKLIEYLCESNMIKGLYSFLVVKTLSCQTKVTVLKIIKYCLESKQVSRQGRIQLRLEINNIGFGGIVSAMALNELNESILNNILDLIMASNSLITIQHLNIVLTLCSALSVDIRCLIIRRLMKYFTDHPSTCHLYAKCHGWQETLANFFVRKRRASITQVASYQSLSHDVSSLDNKFRNHSLNQEYSDLKSLNGSHFHWASCSEDCFDDKHSQESNLLSATTTTINMDLKLKNNYSKHSLTSSLYETSTKTLNTSRQSAADLHQYSNETIITPPESTSTSKENLSLFTNENSVDSPMETINSHADLSASISRVKITSTSSEIFEDSTNRIHPLIINNQGNNNTVEEMCDKLILVIVMILWKGIIDCDDAAWTARGQMFSALRHLNREYDLYLPAQHIERRILELSMSTCLNDIELDGEDSKLRHNCSRLERRRISLSIPRKLPKTFECNCHELIKLVNDFLSQSTHNDQRITEELLNGIIPILDTMIIFRNMDDSSQSLHMQKHPVDVHWSETFFAGFNILLILLTHSNVLFCEQAFVRIHSLLNCRPLNGREEAAYILSNLDRIRSSLSSVEHAEHYHYILSLMKIAIEKSYDLLSMNTFIGHLSVVKENLTTLDGLTKCLSLMECEIWQNLIDKVTSPYADHYQSMSIKPFQMNMEIWWNNCHEIMHFGIHKRNRQIQIERLKFQNHIVQPWHQRSHADDQRLLKLNEKRRLHKINVNREWNNRKKYLYGERGLYLNEKISKEYHWLLSNRENIHRMRCKLVENDCFTKHEESSRLRDNLCVDTKVDRQIKKSIKCEQNTNLFEQHESIDVANQITSLLFEDIENIIIGTKCSLITSTAIVDGEFIISDKYIYFFDLSKSKPCQHNMKHPLLWLQEIYLRQYNLRTTALELFFLDQTNVLFNFDKKLRHQIVQKLLSLKLPFIRNSSSTLGTAQEMLQQSKITNKWIHHEISNFDYLMMLNTIAGRSYNDLNQYPIFPWILKDYSSQVLDINNPEIYRDFSKPIGIQNPKHIDEVKLKYESFDDPTGLINKFHYGTHYSNAATVMHYLIRLEPFATLHIQLQSGRFDIADRQFHSFQSSWANIMDSPNDGKELIPEFFYLPEFLVNTNGFDLGRLQSNGQYLNDVQLPPWAHNSSEEFIRLHRLALESDYVSAHLHEWIDLIFGYKQRGQTAIDALNVFMNCSYETAVDDSVTREAIDGMIENFGQIPCQLLTEPHAQRLTREQTLSHKQNQVRSLNIFQDLNQIKIYIVDILPANHQTITPIVFISIPKNQIRSFVQQGTPDLLITVNIRGTIGHHGWMSCDKSVTNPFIFEQDPTSGFEKNQLTTTALFSPSIDMNSRLFELSHDGKYLFSGGHWDYSLCIYSLAKSKTINSIIYHTDVITCLALDSTGYILVTGSRDTTCVIWHDHRYITNMQEHETTTILTPEMVLYGHTAEVTCVCISSELDLVISGSLDGTCNIHTVEHGTFVRTLRPTDSLYNPIINLKLSGERHILVQTKNDETHLFLYSINGHLVRTRKFQYDIADMLLADQYIVLAVNHPSTIKTKSDSTSSFVSRIIIKDMFEMTTMKTIRLQTQICCIYLTKNSSHLLVSLKNGKLLVFTPEKRVVQKVH